MNQTMTTGQDRHDTEGEAEEGERANADCAIHVPHLALISPLSVSLRALSPFYISRAQMDSSKHRTRLPMASGGFVNVRRAVGFKVVVWFKLQNEPAADYEHRACMIWCIVYGKETKTNERGWSGNDDRGNGSPSPRWSGAG